MNITIFGSTGGLGSECLQQALEQGHRVTVMVRNPQKLSEMLRNKISVVQGDALKLDDVRRAIPHGTEAILFAIGVDEKSSPRNLCTDVTRHILQVMRELQAGGEHNALRLVWCGGGSNFLPGDQITFSAKFVRWWSETFLKHRHSDKEHQLELLLANQNVTWLGIRPLQMGKGARTGKYRLGYNTFSGLSKISFADCAHAMLGMLGDDTWIHKAPVVQY
jgi:putative NADH-flavin reductase